jgi:dihydrofolate reductase
MLGRKTYEIFAAHRPYAGNEDPIAARFNRAKKYVALKTLQQLTWNNSELINGDVATEVRRLKALDGPQIQVHGSGNLIQTLLQNDLVEEFWLKIFPITLGKGKRLFANGTIAADSGSWNPRFRLMESSSRGTDGPGN